MLELIHYHDSLYINIWKTAAQLASLTHGVASFSPQTSHKWSQKRGQTGHVLLLAACAKPIFFGWQRETDQGCFQANIILIMEKKVEEKGGPGEIVVQGEKLKVMSFHRRKPKRVKSEEIPTTFNLAAHLKLTFFPKWKVCLSPSKVTSERQSSRTHVSMNPTGRHSDGHRCVWTAQEEMWTLIHELMPKCYYLSCQEDFQSSETLPTA